MRKLLLLIFAVAASVTVSAQAISNDAARIKKGDLTNVTPQKFTDDVKIKHFNFTPSTQRVKKAEEASVCGAYIYNEIREDISVSYTDTIKSADMVDGDGTVYNVALRIPGYVFSDFYGSYDEETGIITVPCGQIIWTKEENEDYDCGLYGFEGEYYTDEMHFVKQDDGSLILQEEGMSVVIVEEGHQYEGYYIIMTEGTQYLKPNATQASFKNDGSGWPAGDDFNYVDIAYVEDWETNLNVYNFCGFGVVSFNVNDDLTVSVAPGQVVDDYDWTAWGKRNGYPYDFGHYMAVAVDVDEEGYLIPNEERDIIGRITNNGNVLELDGYLAIMSHYITNVGCLRDAYHYGWGLILSEGTFAAGVHDITMSREDKLKNSRTYNLMGQQVDGKTAKGLLIRNGKKFIAK